MISKRLRRTQSLTYVPAVLQGIDPIRPKPETNEGRIQDILLSHDEAYCSDVYMDLIVSGTLSDLKLLIKRVNRNHKNEQGVDFVQMAAIAGRIDVLHWLVHEQCRSIYTVDVTQDGVIEHAIANGHLTLLHELVKPIPNGDFGLSFILTTDNPSRHPVMRAVCEDQAEILMELVKPASQGGFGLSTNVRSRNDHGLVALAMYHDARNVLRTLLLPVEQGGLGLKLESADYRSHDPNQQDSKNRRVIYYREQPDNNTNSVIELDIATGISKEYQHRQILGKGAYGFVQIYSHGSELLAVKKPCINWRVIKDPQLIHYYQLFKSRLGHEHKFMALAYPDDGPYILQHQRTLHSGNPEYSFKIIMPFFKGVNIEDFFVQNHDSLNVAKAILSLASEVNRIHQLGFIHGDIRKGNFLIDADQNGQLYRVRFFDFYFACKFEKRMAFFLEKNKSVPPESTNVDTMAEPSKDVYMLAYTINEAIKKADIELRKKLHAQFPSIVKFIVKGVNVYPGCRPTLSKFIAKLRGEIEGYKPEPEKQSTHIDSPIVSRLFHHVKRETPPPSPPAARFRIDRCDLI